MNNLYLIVPCFNEEETLKDTARELKRKITSLIQQGRIGPDSRILFVDDGSKDTTLQIVRKLHEENACYSYLSFSRNFGHQSAVLAGLFFAVEQGADVTISIDADLQQDIEAIGSFLEKYENGADIVYGVRDSRNTDSFLKKLTATAFYDLMNLFGCNVLKNHADYRLMSARAVLTLKEFQEVNLFLRGIVPLCGYDTDIVYFQVRERKAGSSKYTAKKMINFALDGITSLSMKPVRYITMLGMSVFILSLVLIAFYVISNLTGNTVSGWTSMITSVWALGGIQLMAIGIVGEYVGKTYIESKRRPRYIIREYGNARAPKVEEESQMVRDR